eukprot:s395_g24.t1
MFVLCIDLSEAFDGVSRSFLWQLLSWKLGVPQTMAQLLDRIYTGMQARVCRGNGRLSRSFAMSTGVRQGSIEGPVLFLLYYSFLLRLWRQRCADALGPDFGIPWCSTKDGTLRETGRARQCATEHICFQDSVFANDTALLSNKWNEFGTVIDLFSTTLVDLVGR